MKRFNKQWAIVSGGQQREQGINQVVGRETNEKKRVQRSKCQTPIELLESGWGKVIKKQSKIERGDINMAGLYDEDPNLEASEDEEDEWIGDPNLEEEGDMDDSDDEALIDLSEDGRDLGDERFFEYFHIEAPWEREQLVEAQREDLQYGKLIEYLEDTIEGEELTETEMKWIIAEEPHYVIWQEVLYRVKDKKTPVTGEPIELQLVVPEIFRELLMEMAHDSKYAGHLGYTKVVGRLKEKYFWVGMNKDVKEYIERCVPCARFKKGPNRRGPLQPVKAMAPFHMVAIDVVGPLPETERGNKYIVCCMDYYTKWPMAFPTKDQTGETLSEIFQEQIIPMYGVPRILISDQGPAFKSHLFQMETESVGTKLCYTSPYRHQANGLVEKWNRTLMGMIRPLTELEPRQWDRFIGGVLLAYRTTPHCSTGNTPFFLMQGRDPDIPGERKLFSMENYPLRL